MNPKAIGRFSGCAFNTPYEESNNPPQGPPRVARVGLTLALAGKKGPRGVLTAGHHPCGHGGGPDVMRPEVGSGWLL